MKGDGNGWVKCALGHSHWGRNGAAGLLLHTVDDAGVARALLQHRALWSHHGGTWGLPGGARDSHEDAVETALREAVEEAGVDPTRIRTRHAFVDDHEGWTYTTVYADTPVPIATALDRESVELDWVALDAVTQLRLHPGFAATWPRLRAEPVTLLVDVANVVGARPDGWWRDRAGASTRLLRRMDELRGVTVRGPGGQLWVVRAVEAVLEGAARSADDPAWVRALRTRTGAGSGDDLLVSRGSASVVAGGSVVAITADRGLRDRLIALEGSRPQSIQCVGPRWLLELLDTAQVHPH